MPAVFSDAVAGPELEVYSLGAVNVLKGGGVLLGLVPIGVIPNLPHMMERRDVVLIIREGYSCRDYHEVCLVEDFGVRERHIIKVGRKQITTELSAASDVVGFHCEASIGVLNANEGSGSDHLRPLPRVHSPGQPPLLLIQPCTDEDMDGGPVKSSSLLNSPTELGL